MPARRRDTGATALAVTQGGLRGWLMRRMPRGLLVAIAIVQFLGWRGCGTLAVLGLASSLWPDAAYLSIPMAVGWGYVLWRWRPSVVRERGARRREAAAIVVSSSPARRVERLTARAAKVMGGEPDVRLLGDDVAISSWPDSTDDTPGSKVWREMTATVSYVMGAEYRIAKAEPGLNRARWEPVPPLPERVPYRVLDLPAHLCPLGIGEDGPVLWDLDETPHMLLAGDTGKGKSILLNSVAAWALRTGKLVKPHDGKYAGSFRHLDGRPGVLDLEDEGADEVARGVRHLYEEMERRYAVILAARMLPEGSPSPEPPPPVIAWVDEFTSVGLELSQSNRKEYFKRLTLLLQKGREAGIHLVLAAQRPDVDLMGEYGGAARTQLGMRVGVGLLSEAVRKMLFEEQAAEAAGGEDIRGRGLAGTRGSVPQRFQAWWLASSRTAGLSVEDRKAAEAALPPRAQRHDAA